MAVKVIASPSQNVDEEIEDGNAVDVKLTIGFAPTLIVIPGEIEEQPPPVAVSVEKDSTVTVCPSIRVLVTNRKLSDLAPTGLPSILKICDNPSVAVKVTVSLPQIATVSGAATPNPPVLSACKPEIGDSLTAICIILLYSSHVAPP